MLLKKTFNQDVLVCPRCGGTSRVLAAVTEPGAIQKILQHLRLPSVAPRFHQARAPPDAAQLELSNTYDAA
jgi:hypothetical protein